jgi:periplasmic divalent cation tolerance protein
VAKSPIEEVWEEWCGAYSAHMTNDRVWSVTSTTATRGDAVELARSLVMEHLAASAEVTGPAASVFWHLGELGEGEEWRVTLRTSSVARDALAARLAMLHPWDNAEVSAAPVAWCSDSYAEWVERTTEPYWWAGERRQGVRPSDGPREP